MPSQVERATLMEKLKPLQDELRMLMTTPQDNPALGKREKEIRAQIEDIYRRLVRPQPPAELEQWMPWRGDESNPVESSVKEPSDSPFPDK